MRRDQDEIYFDAPLPTASNCRDAQFQQRCAKGKMGMESSIIHKSLLKHVATSQRSLEVSFSKNKKKMGGISTICLRPFVRGKSILKTMFLSTCCT
jgi:hypothetical protein